MIILFLLGALDSCVYIKSTAGIACWYKLLTSGMWLFRFDARLYFTDKAQVIYKPTEVAPSLTPEEEEIERRCDEERYKDLHRDSAEHDIQQGKLRQTKYMLC